MSSEWRSRPALARLVRFIVAVAPILLTIVISHTLARTLPPVEPGSQRYLWWAFVLAITMACLYVLDRLFRRLAPVATLLRISLVFPDEAPGRYSTALRAGATKKLERKVEAVANGKAAFDDETSFATQMLEMVAMLGEHDRLTRGHCERVRAYTDLIMEEMGIEGADADRLRWAALLHDLGKLMVPQWILTKPGRPNETEWEILKTHAAEGQRLAAPLEDWLGDWIRAIGEHHERWDGQGYPNGLPAADIHLGARIVAVADTFDVITSSRSYKEPIPAADARAEIARNAGSQFDPKVVRAFLSIGIGRLRFVAGPLAWISSLFGVSSLPVGVAGTIATAALTVATVGVISAPAVAENIETAQQQSTLEFPIEAATSQPPVPSTTERVTTTALSTSSITSAPPVTDSPVVVTLRPQRTATTRVRATTTAVATPSSANTTATAPTSVAPTTTTAPLVLAFDAAANTFDLAAPTATGAVVGTLSDLNGMTSLQWAGTDTASRFIVAPDGTITVLDATMLRTDGSYGTSLTIPVSALALDRQTVNGVATVNLAALPDNANLLRITEVGTQSSAAGDAFVEIVNPSTETVVVRSLALEVETAAGLVTYSDNDIDGVFTLAPNEMVVFSSGSSAVAGAQVTVNTGNNSLLLPTAGGNLGVRFLASETFFPGALPASAMVDTIATTGVAGAGFGSGTKVAPFPITDLQVAYARTGNGSPVCADSDNNTADFELRMVATFAVPTPGASPCTTPRPVPSPATSLIISEFASLGLIQNSDWVEILNPTDTAISLSTVTFRMSADNGGVFDTGLALATPTGELQPGERIVIASKFFAGTADLRPVEVFQVLNGTMTLFSGLDVLDVVQLGPGATDTPSDRFGPSSWTRLFNGTQDTGNDRMDFIYTPLSTPGS